MLAGSCIRPPRVALVGAIVATLSLMAPAFVGVAAADEPESAVSSPPMAIDDPGTPGPRGFELNLVGTFTRSGRERGAEYLFDANAGIGERLQLKYERPYVTAGEEGGPTQRGLGATEIGVKWRFLERGPWTLATFPAYGFDDGLESEGRSCYLPLIVTRRIGRTYTIASNVGFRRNLDDRGDDVNLALGCGHALGDRGRVMAEVFSQRDPSLVNRETDLRIGWTGAMFARALEHSPIEMDAFASYGHSVGGPGDGTGSILLGLSVVKKPAGE